jgi:HEAT repeat protein
VTEERLNDRIQAVRSAHAHGDVEYLRAALADPDVRSWAARFLGKLGAIEAIPELVRLLSVHDPRTRMASVDALGMLGDRENLPQLISLAVGDPDFGVRMHAIAALGRIGDPRAESPLVDLLGDSNWMITEAAAAALGSVGSQSAIPAIEGAAAKRSFLARGAYRKAVRRIRRAAE